VPVRDQRLVDAVLEHRSVLDEMESEAGSLALRADVRVGQPDFRYQVAAGELGQHPAVDPVGLTGKRGERACAQRVGEAHVPAREFEPVVDEAGAVPPRGCKRWTDAVSRRGPPSSHPKSDTAPRAALSSARGTAGKPRLAACAPSPSAAVFL
jgi:hypothetical protein